MKIEYPLLTLLSASIVAAAPHPFVVTDAAAAAGSENVAVPVIGLDKRQQVSVYGFRKRSLELRNALLAARGGQRVNEILGTEGAQEQASEAEQAAGDEQAPGESKGKSNAESASPSLATSPPAAPGNATEPAEKGKGKGKGDAEDAAAGQEYQLLGDQQAQQQQQQQAEQDQAAADQKVCTLSRSISTSFTRLTSAGRSS